MDGVRVLMMVLGVAFIVAVPPIGIVFFGVWLTMHFQERGRRRVDRLAAEQSAREAQELKDARWLLWKDRRGS
ncbi:MAG: hypothetical protein WCF36_02710 [Candidatus Nanopelagicales bacterium]